MLSLREERWLSPNHPWRPGGEPLSASGPFRIALVGDFSARASRGIAGHGKEISTRQPLRVDRDSLNDVMARLTPRIHLQLPEGGDRVEIAFSSIDDFHPDALHARLPLFRELRDAGARAMASAEVLRAEGTRPPPATPTNLLDAILGEAPAPPGGAALARAPARPSLQSDADLSSFVARVLAPHLVAGADSREIEIEARVQAATTAAMRSILHHTDFQQLEAAWRGVEFLVRRLDTVGGLQLHLIDVSRDELAADSRSGVTEESGFYRLAVDGNSVPGAPPWALLVALFPLGDRDDDVALLHHLGLVARHAGAPFVAGAGSGLAGTSSISSHPDPDDWSNAPPRGWDELRASTAAPFLALFLPRLLLRVPYGQKSDPCDRLQFEEMEPDHVPPHDHYLWSAGSLAAALLLGEAFTDAGGWSLRPGREIGGLPLHVYAEDGVTMATPCAEVLLTQRAAERLLDRGLTPLLTVRDSDRVIVPRLQSIAEPLRPLQGRWVRRDDVAS